MQFATTELQTDRPTALERQARRTVGGGLDRLPPGWSVVRSSAKDDRADGG
jgi:hypothetical protein